MNSRGPAEIAISILAANPLVFFVLVCLGIAAFIAIGFFAVPIVLIFVAATAYHSYQKQGPSTDQLQRVANVDQGATFPTTNDFAYGALMRAFEGMPRVPIDGIIERYGAVATALYNAEDLANPLPPLPPAGTIEEGRYRDRLLNRTRKLADPDATLALLGQTLGELFQGFTSKLPSLAMQVAGGEDKPALCTIPLIEVLGNVPDMVQAIYGAFASPALVDAGLFNDVRKQLNANLIAATGKASEPVWPLQSKLAPIELIDTYLKDTPFIGLFTADVPFSLETQHRLEHTVVVGGSGHGKTQFLEWMILNDLDKPDPPSLIILDATGQMVNRIQRLAMFSDRLRDRLLIIDPAHSPALNMFDISTARLAKYTPEQREDMQSEIISLFNYIFAADDYDLSSRMGTAFAYAVRVILSRPGSTITDLRRLLEEQLPRETGYAHSEFKPEIEALGDEAKDFFANHFYISGFAGTRLNIAQRLHKVVGIPAFRRMFTSATNALDFFDDMQNGRIILVNTNQDLLKEDSYVLFGRYIIARTLAAAFERATLKPEERRPAYLIVDEAAPYFDKTFEALLTRVRQFKLGVVIAFQNLEQANEKLRGAIASSTSIKLAGGLGFTDRRWLAREMETTEAFINAQKKEETARPPFTRFAAYVRNYTPHAVSLTVPIGLIDSYPKMDEHTYQAMLAANLKRVAPAPPPVEPSEVQQTSSQLPPTPSPATHTPESDDLPTTWGGDKI